jgi:hypothetical protein
MQMNSRRALLIFTLLAAIVGCQPATEKTIPDDLLGVWKTSEPKYTDRFFELKKDAIIIATGENNTDTYSVASVEQAHDALEAFQARALELHEKAGELQFHEIGRAHV